MYTNLVDQFTTNIDKCYKKEKEVINDIRNYTNRWRRSFAKSKHLADETGSTKTVTQFYFKTGGVIKVSCFDWSKYMEKGVI